MAQIQPYQRLIAIICAVSLMTISSATASVADKSENILRAIRQAPVHKDIITTVFWVGERAKPNSGWSDNLDSAWDKRWKENFGGLDSPIYRKGYHPAKFQPKQNPFYVALPFNDISNPEYLVICPLLKYFKIKAPPKGSVCKNRWIEIVSEGKACYAQWQDVGPYYTNDFQYVFEGEQPKAHNRDLGAGLDVSPAIRDFLSLKGGDRTNWRFVDDKEVPEGPWSEIVTKS